jgi:hypothetical protein
LLRAARKKHIAFGIDMKGSELHVWWAFPASALVKFLAEWAQAVTLCVNHQWRHACAAPQNGVLAGIVANIE